MMIIFSGFFSVSGFFFGFFWIFIKLSDFFTERIVYSSQIIFHIYQRDKCPFFSNLQNSMVLTIFLHIMDSLLNKYDMLIFFCILFSGFRIFSEFFPIFIKSSDFLTESIIYFSHIIFFLEVFPVSGFFQYFSGFPSNL